MKTEMVNSSNHTTATVDETVETQTIDIDMDLLKKEENNSNDANGNETWTGLNDSCNIRAEEEGNETVKSGSVTSEPKRQFSRRNSNESVCSKGSTGSSGSKSSAKSASKRKSMTKRRSWKKPKDKPKRPLSAYNIFFKHTRSRIVEGLSAQGTTEETIASIESIVANSTETRRHRKTHGQISFGDLARTIADNWKTIDKDHRALFDHYAALDMKRYRREVSIWKAKKEAEALAGSGEGGSRSSSNLEVSGNSALTDTSQATIEVGENFNDWNTPQARAFTSSFRSVDSSDDDFGIVEPLPIADLQESQNSGMMGLPVPSFIESTSNGNMNNMMVGDNTLGMNGSNNGYGNNMNGDSIQSRKLQDIWMKNRQLEDSINKLKKELSATNFQLGNGGNNMNMPENTSNSKFMNSPFQGGPSIDRMQQLHRRRLLMGDVLPPMANGQMHPNQMGMSGNNNNFGNVQGGMGADNEMQMDPFDMNPIPLEEVFNASGAEANMKKKELITNLNQIDFFRNGAGN